LIHRSYREHAPIQVIRYANRLEFRNPGYSLAPEENFGKPGSYARNPTIASVVHELSLAEIKGSGIRTMINLMEENGLSAPALDSDRISNSFSVQLLFHHFLSEDDIKWLAGFRQYNLTDAQNKALIFIRETGAINNASYRNLNKVDTLKASQQLKELCDKGLISQEGSSNATYYVPNPSMLNSKTQMPGEETHMLEGKTHMSKSKTHMLEPPNEVTQLIGMLGKKPKLQKIKDAVLLLCKWRDMGAEEITIYLKRNDSSHIVRTIINPMIRDGLIEPTIPESRKHPNQKYRAIK
jgi:ATP-dependent DNA helicase RecG